MTYSNSLLVLCLLLASFSNPGLSKSLHDSGSNRALTFGDSAPRTVPAASEDIISSENKPSLSVIAGNAPIVFGNRGFRPKPVTSSTSKPAAVNRAKPSTIFFQPSSFNFLKPPRLIEDRTISIAFNEIDAVTPDQRCRDLYNSEVQNDAIMFEDENNYINLTNNHPQCNLTNSQVWYNETCYGVLDVDTCPENKWRVLSSHNIPECLPRCCPGALLYHNGKCVDASDPTVCPKGQILYVNFYGVAHCDCITDFYYHAETDTCYEQHDQGICEANHYMHFDQFGNSTCVENPCGENDRVFYNGECYLKNYLGYCPSADVVPVFNSSIANCVENHLIRGLFTAPTLRSCAPGTRADHFGRCRDIFRIPTAVRSRKVGCNLRLFKVDENGKCIRAYRRFENNP